MNTQPQQQASSDTTLLTALTKAINGEYEAIYCYEQLANQAPNTTAKNRILEIRNDEIRHYHTFAHLYTSLTGQQPAPYLSKQCPPDYRQGVLAAFIDEQETVDFYHETARNSTNPIIKEAFSQAANDEQNHAVWFLYFMNSR